MKNLKNKIKNVKGITLISLVITIIVLLILAGITLAMVMGDSGIFSKANRAKEQTNAAQAVEDVKLKIVEVQTEKEGNATLADLIEKLEEAEDIYKVTTSSQVATLGEGSDTVSDLNVAEKIYVTNTKYGYEVEVAKDLSITNNGTDSQEGESEETQTVGKVFGIDLTVTKGEGTEESPYIITTKEQLMLLSMIVNSGESFEGKYIKLANDITLDSTKQWIPIGNDTTYFQGTFDGNGKQINGIFINNTSTYQGLFGVIGKKGKVKKVITKGQIASDWSSGGIAGNNMGIIEKCANYASIRGNVMIGGIAGSNNGLINECYNRGTISGTSWGTGGIAGYLGSGDGSPYDGIYGSKVGYIYNCYNNATITSGQYFIGGIAGVRGHSGGSGYIYNCYSITTNSVCNESRGGGAQSNNYTTNANTKLNELNAGIDEVGKSESTMSPFITDDATNPINGGYPILSWQNE